MKKFSQATNATLKGGWSNLSSRLSNPWGTCLLPTTHLLDAPQPPQLHILVVKHVAGQMPEAPS